MTFAEFLNSINTILGSFKTNSPLVIDADTVLPAPISF